VLVAGSAIFTEHDASSYAANITSIRNASAW
jgi:pentose-5-phosphate-3-epimerase